MLGVYDILGCGFGPANLAIAAALTDKWAAAEAKHVQRALFVEKHPEFLWHPGMLIPGSRMQISCLKDLVTLRNPSSPLTFLSYLHSQDRLVAFINRGSTIPTRREFADYLSWAAREVEKRGIEVAYAEEVIGISKVHVEECEQELIEVTTRLTKTGELVTRRTKSLIISPGGSPIVPPVLSALLPPSGGVWDGPGRVPDVPVIHSSSYMTSIETLLDRLPCRARALKIAIVGSGQSAAECLLDVHRRLESLPPSTGTHQLHMIIRKGSLKPSDDSPFVNEIFDPEKTSAWYNYPSENYRRSILAEYKNTNYSVVNPLTLDTVYELIYDQKLSDGIATRKAQAAPTTPPRVTIRTYQKIVSASTQAEAEGGATHPRTTITLTCQHLISHDVADTTYDAVICGTGYDRTSWLRLLRASNLAEDYIAPGRHAHARARAAPAVIRLAPEHHHHHRPHHLGTAGIIALAGLEHVAHPEEVVEEEAEQGVKYELVDFHDPDADHDADAEPDTEAAHRDLPSLLDASSSPPHSSSGSSANSPPSSPGLSLSVPVPRRRAPAPVALRISRNYRLVPLPKDAASPGSSSSSPSPSSSSSTSRIYLQGCAEATHGLSDTLLSVLGVRAGEVLDDLCGEQ